MSIPKFPEIKRSITDFIHEEEANIPRNKMLTLGTMVILLSILFMQDALAGHRSHSSHSSHSSHRSHSSHSSHRSGNHNSHSSHSNTRHSNVTPKPTATPVPVPSLASLPQIQTPQPNTYSATLNPLKISAAASVPNSNGKTGN